MTATFKDYCRFPSGRALCDSGDFYGRAWEKPPIDDSTPPIVWDQYGCTIEASAYLSDRFYVDSEIQAKFAAWEPEQEGSWFELGTQFMESLGYFQHAGDNVYNRDNDLSQVFVWEVWTNREDEPDWSYPKGDCITVVYIHTGCDVRGGYSGPLFCRQEGDYPFPADPVAEFRAYDPQTGEPLQDVDERWQAGYSAWPYGEMEGDMETFHEDTRTVDSVEATLKTGERVRVVACIPYGG